MKTFKLLLFVYSTLKHLLVSSFGTAIFICFITISLHYYFLILFFCNGLILSLR